MGRGSCETPWNNDAILLGEEEDDMAFVFHPPQANGDLTTVATDEWEVGYELTEFF